MKTAVQVTMYLNESDKWNQILQMLRRENVVTRQVPVFGMNQYPRTDDQ